MPRDGKRPDGAAQRPSAPISLGGSGQRLAVLGQQDGQEFRRLSRAGVARYAVHLSRRLQEHLPDRVGLLRPVTHLRADGSLQHIGNRDPRMAVRGRAIARSVGDLYRRHRPTLEFQVGQSVLEDHLGTGGLALSGQNLRRQGTPSGH
jgi:hypothetical protein